MSSRNPDAEVKPIEMERGTDKRQFRARQFIATRALCACAAMFALILISPGARLAISGGPFGPSV